MPLANLLGLLLAATGVAQPPAATRASGEPPSAAAARVDSVAALQDALQASPRDADLLRRLGAALAAEQRYGEALAALDRAQALAPADVDIMLERARVLVWSGQMQLAARAIAAIADADPRDAELPALRKTYDDALALPVQSATPRAGAFGIADTVSRVSFASQRRATWNETDLYAYSGVGHRTTLAGDIAIESRSGATDTHIGARLDKQVGTDSFYVGLAGTPRAAFRETFSVAAGGEHPLGGDLRALLATRFADYDGAHVASFSPGLRYRVPHTPLSLTGSAIVVVGDGVKTQPGGSARADLEWHRGTTLFVGGANYADTETGVTRRVDAAFGGGSVPIGERLSLSLAGSYERRHQSYERKSVTLGVRWRFGP